MRRAYADFHENTDLHPDSSEGIRISGIQLSVILRNSIEKLMG
jgi:hypothetical protein